MDCYGEANEGDIAGPVDDPASLEAICAEHCALAVTGDWLAAIRAGVSDDLAVVQGAAHGVVAWWVCSYTRDQREVVLGGPYETSRAADRALQALRGPS